MASNNYSKQKALTSDWSGEDDEGRWCGVDDILPEGDYEKWHRIPHEWWNSKTTPMIQDDFSPRLWKLPWHEAAVSISKLWDRIIEARLRGLWKILRDSYGLQRGKSKSTCSACIPGELQMNQQEAIEKAYMTPSQWTFIWYTLSRRGVPKA